MIATPLPLQQRAPLDVFEVEVLTPLERADLRDHLLYDKKVDETLILNLASLMMDVNEIAFALGMPADLIEKEYAHIIEQGNAEGKLSLRRAQWRVAIRGNVQMLIHLGEQHLDQKGPTKRVQVEGSVKHEHELIDPREVLLTAMQEAATRLRSAQIKELPLVEIAASEGEF